MPRAKTKVYRVVRTNLNAQVYDILKEMIADRRFAPGSSLNVERLTQELGVSRTPIWEAIRRLEQEGIVFHTPHKGVRLVELTRKMALELYEVRETMEAMARTGCVEIRYGIESGSDAVLQRTKKGFDSVETIDVVRRACDVFRRVDLFYVWGFPFESMDDFSPAEVARKVEPLAKLLQARTELSNLLTYMDGKTGAEELIAKLIEDPALMRSLTAAPNADAAPAPDAGETEASDEPKEPTDV